MVEPERAHDNIYNTAHARCVLDNHGYRHTLRVGNVCCFSTATVVKRRHLDVTLIRTLPALSRLSNARLFGVWIVSWM